MPAIGQLVEPVLASQVDAPLTGAVMFLEKNTRQLFVKYPDGTSVSLQAPTGAPLQSQAVNEGTVDAMEFTITGVASYTSGDIYYLMTTGANTGACTIDINAIGVKNIKYKGTIAAAIPASTFADGAVQAFLYDGTQFQWLGTVKGNQVVIGFSVTYVELKAIGLATAAATVDLMYCPPKAALCQTILRPTTVIAGGTTSAAVAAMTNLESTLNVFGGNVDLMGVPAAADKGGVASGLKSNTDIPYQVGTQTYRIVHTLTGDVWNNVTAGAYRFEFAWQLLS